MSTFSYLFRIFVILLCCFNLVKCHCVLNYNNEFRTKPYFYKFFGTKLIDIPYTEDTIFFQENESIFGSCATEFEPFRTYYNVYENVSNVQLKCNNNQIIYTDGDVLQLNSFSCANLSWGLYEQPEKFKWCGNDDVAYVMGSNYLQNDITLGGACYDVKNGDLHSVLYTKGPKITKADPNKLRFWEASVDIKSNWSIEIKNYEGSLQYLSHLSQDSLDSGLQRVALENSWIQIANYEYQLIVQDKLLEEYFEEFYSLLQIIWWRSLRLGNWQRFMNVMDQRAENISYYMYVGTSGAVKIPLNNDCQQRTATNIILNRYNKTIPAYIWNYVQSMDGSDEFVFVGYNSPYYDFFNKKDIIFCEDICSRISWIKDIQSTFRYSTLGVTFCCDVKEIRAKNLLDGFPLQDLKTSMETTTTTVTEGTIANAGSIIRSLWLERKDAEY